MFKKHLDRMAGQGLLEYALVLLLVAIVVIGALAVLGPFVADLFDTVVEQFSR